MYVIIVTHTAPSQGVVMPTATHAVYRNRADAVADLSHYTSAGLSADVVTLSDGPIR